MTLASEFREAVRIAWSSLRSNVLRTSLTTLGIVIGILTVTLMGTAITGLNSAFRKSVGAIGADVLFIQRFSWFSSEAEWRASRNRKELTLQQARDVGEDGRAVVVLAHAQVGHERRERVGGDFGFGGRQSRQQRRLARVGHPHQTHVRHHF